MPVDVVLQRQQGRVLLQQRRVFHQGRQHLPLLGRAQVGEQALQRGHPPLLQYPPASLEPHAEPMRVFAQPPRLASVQGAHPVDELAQRAQGVRLALHRWGHRGRRRLARSGPPLDLGDQPVEGGGCRQALAQQALPQGREAGQHRFALVLRQRGALARMRAFAQSALHRVDRVPELAAGATAKQLDESGVVAFTELALAQAIDQPPHVQRRRGLTVAGVRAPEQGREQPVLFLHLDALPHGLDEGGDPVAIGVADREHVKELVQAELDLVERPEPIDPLQRAQRIPGIGQVRALPVIEQQVDRVPRLPVGQRRLARRPWREAGLHHRLGIGAGVGQARRVLHREPRRRRLGRLGLLGGGLGVGGGLVQQRLEQVVERLQLVALGPQARLPHLQHLHHGVVQRRPLQWPEQAAARILGIPLAGPVAVEHRLGIEHRAGQQLVHRLDDAGLQR
ncbi:MAG: hypothetical protein ABS53_11780 [Hydrogenophaga sp. SCN 70-13]|nr:MAG: hypothetical protein ABS53_11780 [Hydrogenophaga sp. SCN 70-13]